MAVEPQQGEDRHPIWKRGLFMLLFMIAFGIAQALINLTAIVQFLWLLFASEPNQFLVRFGRSLSVWLADAVRFLSCASDEMPFPGRIGRTPGERVGRHEDPPTGRAI
jgi:hypothetical protein